MSDIKEDDVTVRAAEHIAHKDRAEVATELRKALGRDKPIKCITVGLMANHLALLEETGVDAREGNDEED